MSCATELGVVSHREAVWASTESASLHLREHGLGLRQPEGHPHGTVEVDRGKERSVSLLALARCGIQRPKTPATVRLERAHAEGFGQGESLAVMGRRRLDLEGMAMHSDIAEELAGMRLIAASFVGASEVEEACCEPARLLHTTAAEQGLAQLREHLSLSELSGFLRDFDTGGEFLHKLPQAACRSFRNRERRVRARGSSASQRATRARFMAAAVRTC
jgi:hypothetical protein